MLGKDGIAASCVSKLFESFELCETEKPTLFASFVEIFNDKVCDDGEVERPCQDVS
jgi:hypothetical protein